MGHTLKIIHGSTTIDLSAGDYRIKTYSPSPPRASRDTVVEGISVFIEASSVADLQSGIRDIENAFYLAQQRRIKRLGDRVYLTFLEDGGTTTYRSEIYATKESDLPGKVSVDTKWLRSVLWDVNTVEAKISLERRNYWEESTETELALANGSQTAATGGCTIYNPHNTAVFTDTTVSFAETNSRISDSGNGFGIFAVGDVISLRGSTFNDGIYTVEVATAGYIDVHQIIADEAVGDSVSIYDIQNYVHIDSSEIGGVMPCPIRIVAKNTSPDSEYLAGFWMYSNVDSNPTEFPHILEAEDSSTGSDVANSEMSGGQYRSYTVTTSETKMTQWYLLTQLLEAANGAYFMVMARFMPGEGVAPRAVGAIKFRLKLTLKYSGLTIHDGGQVQFDDTYVQWVELYRELSTIQLPPMRDVGTPEDITLELWAISTTGESASFRLDCLMLLPLNSYRKLRSIDGVNKGGFLHDDGILDEYYHEDGSKRFADVIGWAGPNMAVPGKDMRIYFCTTPSVDNNLNRNISLDVRAYIRPRIATL